MYDLPFFIVTDGASVTSNKGCEVVRVARENHIKYEFSKRYVPYEDWSKDGEQAIDFPSSEYEALQNRLNANENKYIDEVGYDLICLIKV